MRRVLAVVGRILTGFRNDSRGVAALEFALVSPILILTYFGLAELSQGITAQRRVSHAASAIGDLAAQSDKITDANMTNMFAAATAIIAPYPATDLNLRLTSITADAKKKPKVDWVDVKGTMPNTLKKDDEVTLPAGLVTEAGDNIIMAEATYTYKGVAQYVLKDGLKFSEVYYMRPRQVNKVARTVN